MMFCMLEDKKPYRNFHLEVGEFGLIDHFDPKQFKGGTKSTVMGVELMMPP